MVDVYSATYIYRHDLDLPAEGKINSKTTKWNACHQDSKQQQQQPDTYGNNNNTPKDDHITAFV